MRYILLFILWIPLHAIVIGQSVQGLAERFDLAVRLQFAHRDSSNAIAQDLLATARSLGSDSIAIQTIMLLGNNANNAGDHRAAISFYKQALNYDTSFAIHRAMCVESAAKIAQAYLLMGQMDSARVYAERFDLLSDRYLNPNSTWPMILFGELYRTMGRNDVADTYYLKAINRSESDSDTLSKTVSLFYYLSAHLHELTEPAFLPYFEKYLTLTSRLRQDRTIEYVHASMLFGDMEPNEQIALLQEAASRALAEGRDPLGYQLMLTDILMDEHRLQDALDAARSGLAMTARRRDFGHLIDFHHRLAQIYQDLGDYTNAFPHLEKYYYLKDSIEGLEMNKNLDALNIQYETAKKENALLAQSRQIEIRTNQRNLLLIGILGLLCLGAFLIYFFWSKAQLTKRLAAQEKQLDQHRIEQLEREKKLVAMTSMIEGQEAERMRVARDLHDGLGGLLASIKSRFSTLPAVHASEESDTVSTLIDQASQEVRRISHHMAPQALRMGSLREAISDLANHATSSGMHVNFEWHGAETRLSENTEIMLYRIAQELIHNVIKHARATHLLIQVNRYEHELNLLAEDDGIGFVMTDQKAQSGLGLGSLQSRVQFLDGTWDIDSKPGEGTSISVQVPINS